MSRLVEQAARIARDAGVSAYADAPTRASFERDFGGLAKGRCLLVAEPNSAESCAGLVGAFKHEGVGCTLRGAGYGQSGQSVALDTVSLSTRRLDHIGAVDLTERTITVGAGASPRRVLQALDGVGLAPPVLPLNLDMSIGGLLSAGGIGTLSHRHGPVVAHVAHLDVVTGDGCVHSCTPERNRDLFQAVLSGLGQCGLITQATLALRPAPRRMRVFTFLYDDVQTWLADQCAASSADANVNLEGFCWAAAKGLRSTPEGPVPFTDWRYGLHVAVDADESAVSKNLLSSLRPLRKADEHETDCSSYLHRYAPRFSGMVESGAWMEPHPWFEALFPVDHVEDVLSRILRLLPTDLGDGHRFMFVDTQRAPDSFVRPAGTRCGFIGVLPVAFARSSLPKVLATIDELTSLILEANGRRYLSGWLGTDPGAYLRAHFADRYGDWQATRRRYDPGAVFRSALFPDGNRY